MPLNASWAMGCPVRGSRLVLPPCWVCFLTSSSRCLFVPQYMTHWTTQTKDGFARQVARRGENLPLLIYLEMEHIWYNLVGQQ